MAPRIPERNKKAGVCYAFTLDGVELPVVDVTHPAFSLDLGEDALAQLRAQDARDHQDWARKPRFLQRILLFLLRRRSVLMRGLGQGGGSFLSGMNTYLMKLGPGNLGRGYATSLDRRIAARVPVLNIRLRLQAMARLLAGGLDPEPGTGDPLVLVNLGGGPALDSLNALILLRQRSPRTVAGRPIRILVLDLDREGPAFGARALAALAAPGAPLEGLDLHFEHRLYDWSQPSGLRAILEAPGGGILAAGSSEGGLLEYGSDEDILANLAVLRGHTPPDFRFTASLTLDTPDTRATIAMTRLPRRAFTPEALRDLAGRAGWTLEASLEGPTTLCARFRKA